MSASPFLDPDSDSKDDLNIVLNDKDCKNFPSTSGGNGGLVGGGGGYCYGDDEDEDDNDDIKCAFG